MKNTIRSATRVALLGLALGFFAACSSKTESTTTETTPPPASSTTQQPATSSQPDYSKATGTFKLARIDEGGEFYSELRFEYNTDGDSPYALTFSRGNDETTLNGVMILQNDEVFVNSGSEDSDPKCELSLVFKNDQFELSHADQVTCGGKKEDLRGTYVRTSSAKPTF